MAKYCIYFVCHPEYLFLSDLINFYLMGLIRFILACGVVLGHTGGIHGYTPLAGDLAVQSFYIISGFYMALILNEKYIGKNSTYLFYTNRALKIFPLYWIVLIVEIPYSFIIFHFHYPGILDTYSQNWPMSMSMLCFFIFTNLFIVGIDLYFFLGINSSGSFYFRKNAMYSPNKVFYMAFNPMAWTISLELIFYFFAPFIVRKSIKYIIALFLISIIIRLLLITHNLTYHPWDYMFLPAQVMFFMAGILSYHLYVFFKKHSIKNKLYDIIIFFYIIVLFIFYYKFFQESYIKQLFLFSSITLCIPIIFKLTMYSKLDRLLGNLSYPIYISQVIFIKVLPAKIIPKIIDLGFTTLVSTIAFSIILYYLITKPLERLRQKRISLYQKGFKT